MKPDQGTGPVSYHDRVGAVVVAAGSSQRMEGTDKTFAPLLGRPLLFYSLMSLHSSSLVSYIVLVLSRDNLAKGRELVESNQWGKVDQLCTGGQRRQDSVSNGLRHLSDCEWVLVHDAARPLLDEGMIQRGLSAALEAGAAVAAVPVKDTIKVTDSQGLVVDTPSRDTLWAVQTPQIFRRDLLEKAHRRISETVTDDARMVELIGGRVKVFHGSYDNLKVTTPEDLTIVEAILAARSSFQS